MFIDRKTFYADDIHRNIYLSDLRIAFDLWQDTAVTTNMFIKKFPLSTLHRKVLLVTILLSAYVCVSANATRLMNAGFAHEAKERLDAAKGLPDVHQNVGRALADLESKEESETKQKKRYTHSG